MQNLARFILVTLKRLFRQLLPFCASGADSVLLMMLHAHAYVQTLLSKRASASDHRPPFCARHPFKEKIWIESKRILHLKSELSLPAL